MITPLWNQVINSSGIQPKPRYGHRAVVIQELIVIFGGGNQGFLSDIVVYNTLKNHWFEPNVKGDVPSGCNLFGFVASGTRIFMFGGMMKNMKCSNHLYELQASKWEWRLLRPDSSTDLNIFPTQRLGHSFTLFGEKIYLFGGMRISTGKNGSYFHYLNDLYTLDISKECLSWSAPVVYGKPPTPRESHSAVAYKDSQGNESLVIYGGMDGKNLGDIWILRMNSMTWFEINFSGHIPLPRSSHTAILIDEKMLIFGGWVHKERFNPRDQWKVTNQLACLDLSSMEWKKFSKYFRNETPEARAGHVAVEINKRIFIWSGCNEYPAESKKRVIFNDLWCLDIEKPHKTTQIKLLKTDAKSLELQWTPVLSCDSYILQIQKHEINSLSYKMEKNVLSLSSLKPTLSEQPIKIFPQCSGTSAPNETSLEPHPNQCFKFEENYMDQVNPVNEMQSNISYKFLLSIQEPTMANKTLSAETPLTLKIGPKITLGVSSSNLPKNILYLDPLSCTIKKRNVINGVLHHRPICVSSKSNNLVKLGSNLANNLKSTSSGTNKVLKLINVDKGDEKLLRLKYKSNIFYINPSPSSNTFVKPNSLLNNNSSSNSIPSIKDLNTPLSMELDENAITLSNQQVECPQSSQLKPYVSDNVAAEAEISKEQLRAPSLPENVQIIECNSTEIFYISWTQPPGDTVSSYELALIVKETVSPDCVLMIYSGIEPECLILKSLVLECADIEESEGILSVKLIVSAKNDIGFGPALIVKWIFEEKKVLNA